MTQQPHDKFAKQFLEELLAPFGEVRTNKEVTDETRFVDVLFSPTPPSAVDAETLGLLGRIAVLNTTLIEPFRNQPSRTEVRNCLQKLFTMIADVQRRANREDTTIAENDLPRLWILTPSASKALLKAFEAKLNLENWIEGMYFLPLGIRAAIVAINKLPPTPETLWFRLLGRGKV